MSRDYVNEQGKYKVLTIRKLFESKSIWEENDRQNLGNVCNMNKSKNKSIEKEPLHHIKFSHRPTDKILNLKVDHHTGGKLFIHGQKHHGENQLLSLNIPADCVNEYW